MHYINRLIGTLFLLILPMILVLANDAEKHDCADPKACHEEFLNINGEERLAGKTERAVLQKFTEFGEESLPYIHRILMEDGTLIARLGHKSFQELAELTVRKHLDGGSSGHGSYFSSFGKALMPAIVKAVKCEFGCRKDSYSRFPSVSTTYSSLGHALGNMKENRDIATLELMKIAQDRDLKDSVRSGAVFMISYMKEAGLIVEEELLQLRKNEPQFLLHVNKALLGIQSSQAGEIYKTMLEQENNPEFLLSDIAEAGRKANQAGASIVKLLDETHSRTKLHASRTLGFIGYTQSADKLMALFNRDESVKLHWVVVDSLGRMKAKSAIPFLEGVAESHWYPPVRDVAKKSIQHIRNNLPYPTTYRHNSFANEYYQYMYMGLESCKEISLKLTEEAKDQTLHYSTDEKKLRRLAFKSIYSVLDNADEKDKKRLNGKKIITLNGKKHIEYRGREKIIPDVALAVDGGWLVGTDDGESGGNLFYITPKRKAIHILEDNIHNIYKHNNRYFVIVGYSHMGVHVGEIYQLFRDGKGAWSVDQWLDLPGAPLTFGTLEAGEILIDTYGGGTIIISSDGSMRMAECV